jgi:Tetratricopeptide repeat
MGEFEQGLYHLEQALEIQRHLVNKTGRGSPKHQGNESAVAAHQLELADTLFNIGGLCLEWMRRQGPDARRADEAEAAFLECLQLRTRVLGQAHPQTLQVKSLYGIAKSVPRPRRILKTTPSPMQAIRKVDADFDDYTEPPHVRRLNQRNISPVKVPPISPIRPLSEVSSIANEDSNDATSIFRVGGANNTSPQRHETLLTEELTPRNMHGSNMKPSKVNLNSSRNKESEPPLLQITVSREEDETKDVGTMKDEVTSRGTHIYMAPHLVPESPSRRVTNESGDAHANEISFDKDNFTVDTSSEMPRNTSNTSIILPHVSSYDTEENCIISDNGVDSEVGRIHYPLAWNRAGIIQSGNPDHQSKSSRRDIMVVQPIRQQKANADNLQRNQDIDKIDASSTGNVERDDILARARAILTAHDPNKLGITSSDMDEERDGAPPDTDSQTLDHDVDDGIASLGGNWGISKRSKMGRNKGKLTIREMLRDPISNLPEIHEEASRQLKNGNTVDAYRLFDVVLQCQRHLQGPLHPDVAAALHNVGIVQLRSQNHSEALKAFEEAARVRKGSLGKDHPLVAVRRLDV